MESNAFLILRNTTQTEEEFRSEKIELPAEIRASVVERL